MGIFQVGWNQASIAFLTSCVPHLQTINRPILFDIFDIEVDANSSLDEANGTLYV